MRRRQAHNLRRQPGRCFISIRCAVSNRPSCRPRFSPCFIPCSIPFQFQRIKLESQHLQKRKTRSSIGPAPAVPPRIRIPPSAKSAVGTARAIVHNRGTSARETCSTAVTGVGSPQFVGQKPDVGKIDPARRCGKNSIMIIATKNEKTPFDGAKMLYAPNPAHRWPSRDRTVLPFSQFW